MGLFILFTTAFALITALCTWSIIASMRYPPRRTFGSALARNYPTSPAELDLPFKEHTVTYRDGTQTPVWEMTGSGPADTAIIFTHGFGDSRFGALTWARHLKSLVGKIFVYDLRAHGESTAPVGCYTACERDDLVELMDMLVLPERVYLMGASMGAVLSISAAGVLKDRVTGVIADGPYRRPMEPVIGHMRTKRYPPYPFVWLVDFHLAFWWRKYQPFDRVEQTKLTTCPILVLAGTDDPICKYESAQQIAAAAPGGGTLITFHGAGHLNLADHDPERYIEAIRNLVEPPGRQERQENQSD